MGIAYQAQDDIWDATSTPKQVGKTTGIDARNDNPTYISMLGEAGTRKKASRHAEAALVALDDMPERYNPVKFREIVQYMIGK